MKYFKESEFDCHCGRCRRGVENMSEAFLNKLDHARALAGTPFTLTSAYRCQEHNAKINGRVNSAHLTGHAVDIKCTESRARALIIKALFDAEFTRIGVARTFIHVDDDPAKPDNVIWMY